MRLSRTSLYDINYETAVKINEILTEAKDRDSKDIDSSEIANPGEDRGELEATLENLLKDNGDLTKKLRDVEERSAIAQKLEKDLVVEKSTGREGF